MRNYRTCSLALTLILLSVAAQAASDDPRSAVAVEAGSVSPSVSSVAVGGSWGGNGFFRLVVMRGGFEHVHYWTYAQWIKDPSSNREGPKIEKSVEIRELSNSLSSGIGEARFVSGSSDSGVFEVDVFDNETSKKSIVRVRLGNAGDVSVDTPASQAH